MKKLILYIIVMIALLNIVNAIGVGPAHIDVIFESNTKQEITISIYNDESRDMALVLMPRNELADYLEVPEEVIHIKANEYVKQVAYKVNIPEKLKPGTRLGDILIVEVDDKKDYESNIVKASIGIIHQVRVIVPYPDQYLQGTFYLEDMKPGEETEITLGLVNLGINKIENIKANIIISENEEGIAQLKTNEISLKAKEKGKIVAKWNVDVQPGRYHIQAIITYDDKVLLLDKDIDVGEAFLEITDLRTYPFKLGTIARLDVILKNKWNQHIGKVYSDVVIKDAQETEIESYTTGLVDIPAFGTADSPVYWDTKDISEGEYKVNVKTNYMGRFTEKLFETVVSEDNIYVKGSELTGQVTTSSRTKWAGGISSVIILVLIIIIAKLILDKRKPKTPVSEDSHLRLRKYIKEKLKQGYKREVLRNHLLDKGWNENIINEEMLNAEDEL